MNINDITDGKLYGLNDMVKVGCHDCNGCSECCHDMGESVLLDPYDIYRLVKATGKTFDQMLDKNIELNPVDGLILPNLKMISDSMSKDKRPKCSFLNNNGRCSIHGSRPGICRLYPLGRNYEEDKLSYFILRDSCNIKDKTKVKVVKWLDTENI